MFSDSSAAGALARGAGAGAGAGVGAGTGAETLAQLVVLLGQTAKLDHDLVEKVVDLVLVIALAELGGLEALVDDVLGRECHVRHLGTFWSEWITME